MLSFNSGNISLSSDTKTGKVSLNLVSAPKAGPNGGLVDETLIAALSLHEDEAVELATLILMHVTKVRAARLEVHGLDYPYAE